MLKSAAVIVLVVACLVAVPHLLVGAWRLITSLTSG
jgi:hypothetical protein